MYVVKRGNISLTGHSAGFNLNCCFVDGRHERVAFDKVTARIAKLCYNLDMNFVDPSEIAQKVTINARQRTKVYSCSFLFRLLRVYTLVLLR